MAEIVVPQWVLDLKSQPCKCVRCDFCHGIGNVEYETHGYPEYEIESCDQCEGGVSEACDRCRDLEDFYQDQDEARP